jgi:hypothetical protein
MYKKIGVLAAQLVMVWFGKPVQKQSGVGCKFCHREREPPPTISWQLDLFHFHPFVQGLNPHFSDSHLVMPLQREEIILQHSYNGNFQLVQSVDDGGKMYIWRV